MLSYLASCINLFIILSICYFSPNGIEFFSHSFPGYGDADDDDLYESIYEVVNPPLNEDDDDDCYSESDFDEIIEEEEDEEGDGLNGKVSNIER